MTYQLEDLGGGVLVDRGGETLGGVLQRGDRALLINAPLPGVVERLAERGIRRVTKVLFTHHRRELADGLREVCAAFSPEVIVPAAERHLFEKPDAYWQDERSRWRLLCNRIPYHVTHTVPIPVTGAVTDGDVILWEDCRIAVVHTPGYTDGAVSYHVTGPGISLVFCGDLIYAPGRVRDLYCLQRGDTRHGHRVGDYHGFMGSMGEVLSSLDRLDVLAPEVLIPAHGRVIRQVSAAVSLLRARYQALYHSYAGISALRWYFPAYFSGVAEDAGSLPLQATFPLPPAVRRLHGTTWALRAGCGRALLIDPYCEASLEAAERAVDDGTLSGYDAIWLSHYHHDHVEAAERARERFAIPIITDRHVAAVVAHPERYFLTCLSPLAATIDQAAEDGDTWRWHDMTLSAYHFPGQSLYHAGLLVRPDRGPSLFFAGDAVTPTGIDDYCTWNRNWLGRGLGYERCLDLLRDLAPDMVFNQHVDVGFRFSEAALDMMLENLRARERLLADILPPGNPNNGTDEAWVSTYPYEQRLARAASGRVALVVMNHGTQPCEVRAEWVLPEGCGVTGEPVSGYCRAGAESRLWLSLQVDAAARPGRYVFPVRLWFSGKFMGSYREAIVAIV